MTCIIIYLDAKEFFIMNIPEEMFLTIKLLHLTCRKDRIKSPTSKEGWDLFQRTSDAHSRWWMQWHHWCRTFHPWRSNQEEREDQFRKNDVYEAVSIHEGKFIFLSCSIWKHRGKIHSMRLLMKRRHRLWRYICNHYKWSHMTSRIMCANERRPCTSSEDTHGITHTWGAW